MQVFEKFELNTQEKIGFLTHKIYDRLIIYWKNSKKKKEYSRLP